MPGDMFFVNDCGKPLVGNDTINLFMNAYDKAEGKHAHNCYARASPCT